MSRPSQPRRPGPWVDPSLLEAAPGHALGPRPPREGAPRRRHQQTVLLGRVGGLSLCFVCAAPHRIRELDAALTGLQQPLAYCSTAAGVLP